MSVRDSILAYELPAAGRHIPALDGLRGVAILLVLFHHFTLYGRIEPATYLDLQIHRIALSSWVGVDLFFVLSGFLITGILLDSRGSANYFRNFYARRVLRIFPLYYGFLIVFLYVLPRLLSYGPEFADLLEHQLWYWSYLSNVDIGLNGWPRFKGLGHFWSLAIEEQYYLVWPIVVLLLSRRKLAWTCGGLMVAALAIRTILVSEGVPLAAYVLTPARMDTLAVGGLLAVLWRSERGKTLLARSTLPLMLVSALIVLGLFVHYRVLGSLKPGTVTIGYTAIACFFGSLLTLAIAVPRPSLFRRIWESHTLGFFGRYSYALYVFHHLVAIYLPRLGFSAADIPTVSGSQLPGLVLFALAGIAISVGLSLLSWNLLEAPMLSLKKYFAYGSRPEVDVSMHPSNGSNPDEADLIEEKCADADR